MTTPHPDSLSRRNGWLIKPPVTRMMSEAVKLDAVLRESCYSTVNNTLHALLPGVIRNLRRKCRSRGINPDRVLELTVCKIDQEQRARERFKLNPPSKSSSKPTTISPKVPRKVDPLDYQSAPIRDFPPDDPE